MLVGYLLGWNVVAGMYAVSVATAKEAAGQEAAHFVAKDAVSVVTVRSAIEAEVLILVGCSNSK